jgi:hypothetical protein
LTVRLRLVLDPGTLAVISPVTCADGAEVVTVNVAVFCPLSTVTVAGTLAYGSMLLDSETVTFPTAGAVRYTVPVVCPQVGEPPTSVVASSSTFDKTGGGAGALTVVVWFAVLFAVFGSCSLPVTLAVLVKVPAAVACTVTVTVAVALTPTLPRLAVTVPVDPTGGVTKLPWLVVAETNVIEAGRLSVNVTPVPVDVPELLTVSV